MLLVTMGTQPIQCERIINTIIDSNIKEKIVIQSYYKNEQKKLIPKNIQIKQFISYYDMQKYYNEADIIVVSGTGGIFRALKQHKKVIIFPRLGKYKEAINDHGLDMKVLKDEGYAEFVEDERDFKKIYLKCKNSKYKKYISNNNNFIHLLQEEIEKIK